MCTLEEERKYRYRLISLGPKTLADALLKFSHRHRDVASWIERISSNPNDCRETFHHLLTEYREGGSYIPLSESPQYANELVDLLETLEQGVKDPRDGLELLAAFFKSDQMIINRADDSWGEVGNVFSCEAVELFVRYASECPDKAWIIELLLDLLAEDDQGVRGSLATEAHQFLSPEQLQIFERRYRVAARETQA